MIMLLMISGFMMGQPLTGTKTIPGDYPSLANAISALNANGVGTGGVTFVINAGYTETFTSLTAGLIQATGTASDPIAFQKGGAGANPVITGMTVAPNTYDYIIALQGSDYVTFNGINLSEPTGVVEWGFAILKGSGTNGAQNVVIHDCSITLKNSNVNTAGIYSANILPGTLPTALLTVTDAAGANSYNKFYSNSISGCYNGIVVNGYNDPASPYAFYDQVNEIGKDGGNTVTNPGGSTTAANGILTTYQDRLVIANNIITGTVANTTATFAGIQLGTDINANVNVYNNSIGVTFNGTSGTFYGIWNNMGTNFTNNTVNIYNNTVANNTFPSTTSGAIHFIAPQSTAANTNVYGNTVQNNICSSTSATGAMNGFYFFGASTTGIPQFDVHDNTVNGITKNGSGQTNGMWFGVGKSSSNVSVYNNLITNITANTSSVLAGFYYLGGPSNKNLYKNTVTNLTSSAGVVYGCYSGEGYNQYLYNNKFQNLKTNGTGTSGYVYGMYLSGSSNGGPMYVYNNMIAELKAPNGSTGASGATSGGAMCGIYAVGTGLTYLGIYNNSVYLDGTSSVASFSTTAIFLSASPNTIDLRNNIFVNKCAPTSGGFALALKSNAYSIYTLTLTNMNPLCNNNLFYAGIPASDHLIAMISNSDASYFTNSVTLNDYKTLVWPKECSSITGLPAFVQTGASPYDIHIDASLPSICESHGQVVSLPIAVLDDFDNQPRFPNSGYPDNPSSPAVAPDLGADEFAGIHEDLTGPAIVYTPLLNGTSLDVRTLTATITDAHGVPTDGIGLPRLRWKTGANGTWAYVDGIFIGNSQYTFEFGGNAHTGDTIFYYVVAQDLFTTPNTGVYPLLGYGGLSTNPPAASVPPVPSNYYKITAGRCGVLQVGVGKTYPTLTAAINDINTEGITCPTVLELTDNLYLNETYPIIINPIAGASATNTLTIRPAAGATPVLSCSYLGASPYYFSQISLNGAQYVIIDGSNSGGTDRSMTFENTAGNGFAAPIGLYNNGTVGAGNITIKNCVIKAHTDFVYNAQGIVFYTVTGNAAYHDVIINNNEITNAAVALRIGGTTTGVAQNVQVTNNIIGSADPAKIVCTRAIVLAQVNNILIEGNDMMLTADGTANYGPPAPMIIQTGSGTSNLTIRRNKIHDLNNLGGGGGAIGIYLASLSTTLTEISNNVIYNIKGIGSTQTWNGQNPTGLLVQSGSNFKIVNNTISMQGNFLGASTPAFASCVTIMNNITGIEFKNNILSNSAQQASGTPIAHKNYCIITGTSPVFTGLNYNDYSATGVGAKVGYYASADRPTLADWQAACGQDGASLAVDPVFAGATNFMPTTTLMPKKGIYIPSVPTDIVGVVRTNPPDIGAYEFTTMPGATTTAATDVTVNTATLNGIVNANGFDMNVYFDYGLTSSYGTTVNGTPFTVNGGLPLPVNAPLTGLAANSTYHFRVRVVTFGAVTVYGNDMTFTTQAGIPSDITVTGTLVEGNSNCYNATNSITVAGGGNTFVVQNLASATLIAWQKISFLPGTTVELGGYLHGYISYGTLCPSPAAPVKAGIADEPANAVASASFLLYPNPTTGNFTLQQKGDRVFENVSVEIFSAGGNRIFSQHVTGEKSYDFGFGTAPAGVYFVRLVAEGYSETLKLVKL